MRTIEAESTVRACIAMLVIGLVAGFSIALVLAGAWRKYGCPS